jgi:hypothetical protein
VEQADRVLLVEFTGRLSFVRRPDRLRVTVSSR